MASSALRGAGAPVASGAARRALAVALAVVAAMACLLLAPVARADGRLRTVLVIDASSSMRATDPRGLRKVAAELYVDLARDGDQIAVTGFDGVARESTGGFVTIGSPADRDRLKRSIRGVGNDGSWTDFTAGLSEAKRLLDAEKDTPGDQEFVLFLTDGRCDPDPKGPLVAAQRAAGVARSEDFCQQRVLGEIVPQLGAARVYAIGLSRSAPRAFLEDLARRSGGVGLATDRAEELPHLFADVYARLLGSTLVEGATGADVPLAVDEGALSLDVVIVGLPSLKARLSDPSGAEVPVDNRNPKEAYYADSPAYRLFKVQRPAVGSWRLSVTGGTGKYAALQNLDLRLGFVDLPDVTEIGKPRTVRVRLATPGGKTPPAAFLDRHQVTLRVAEAPEGCLKALDGARAVPLRRGAGGSYEVARTPSARGELCFEARMEPGPGGVLSRVSPRAVVRVVPPLHLAGAPVRFSPIKQGASGKATLSLEGSEIGEEIEAELSIVGRSDLELDPDEIDVEPKGPRTFALELDVDRDARPGAAKLQLVVKPTKPKGYEARALTLELELSVVPLTFWERYGFWIQVGAGGLVLLIGVLGYALPARFKRRAVLRYKDVRDPDLPREGSYPLGVKAKSGFFRGARQRVGPTGPVRTGGVVELSPGPGGGVFARPLGGKSAREVPREDPSGLGPTGEPRPVALKDGRFRCSPGTRYEIEGAGLLFWMD